MMDATIEAVSRLYTQLHSIKETARRVGCSEQKARKILITLGQYSTPRIKTVNAMYADGKSIDDIAAALHIGRKAVSSLLPYDKGVYNAEYPTINALRIKKSRAKKDQN